jgi:hypothetical protein
MSGNHLSRFPRLAPAAGPSPEGSPVFFGVTMPRRRLQGWRLWGNLADELDDPIDFYDFLRLRGIIDDGSSEDSERDEFEELAEYYDNQRW